MNVDKKQAYLDFSESEGKEYNDSILENINSLKERKQEIKEINELC